MHESSLSENLGFNRWLCIRVPYPETWCVNRWLCIGVGYEITGSSLPGILSVSGRLYIYIFKIN